MPRSCAAAVLYYQPVAEQVVDLARRPSALPQVRERSRSGFKLVLFSVDTCSH